LRYRQPAVTWILRLPGDPLCWDRHPECTRSGRRLVRSCPGALPGLNESVGAQGNEVVNSGAETRRAKPAGFPADPAGAKNFVGADLRHGYGRRCRTAPDGGAMVAQADSCPFPESRAGRQEKLPDGRNVDPGNVIDEVGGRPRLLWIDSTVDHALAELFR
jgi:hypothetical protein